MTLIDLERLEALLDGAFYDSRKSVEFFQVMPDLLRLARQALRMQWHPMSEMPEDRQVIVCWSDDEFDTIGLEEYLQCREFGEPAAKGWMEIPEFGAAPASQARPRSQVLDWC